MEQIEASLTRLGTDYIDLYQTHGFDPNTPVEQTMEALHDVVKAGKARYLGASSMYAWRFAKLQHAAVINGWTRFVSMQDQYNLLNRGEETEMFGLLADQGVVTRPWEDRSINRDAVQQIASTRGVSMAQVALAWVLRTPSSPPLSSAPPSRTTSPTPPPHSSSTSLTTRSPRSRVPTCRELGIGQRRAAQFGVATEQTRRSLTAFDHKGKA